MNLWTVHPPEFLITEGYVDHSQSEYYKNTPGVKEAYQELWDHLDAHDGQLVWCYTHEEDIRITGVEKTKWTLSVPEPSVLRLIDDLVWNRILGIECNVRSDMRRQWREEALEKYPDDARASRAHEQECLEAFWRQEPKGSGWWDELFADQPGECVSALVGHPVPVEWVVERAPLRSGR